MCIKVSQSSLITGHNSVVTVDGINNVHHFHKSTGTLCDIVVRSVECCLPPPPVDIYNMVGKNIIEQPIVFKWVKHQH